MLLFQIHRENNSNRKSAVTNQAAMPFIKKKSSPPLRSFNIKTPCADKIYSILLPRGFLYDQS